MDKTQNLDPQLRQTYERVMGTNVASAPTAAQPPASTPTPPASANETKIAAGDSKGTQLSPILIGVAIVLFFAIYTLVWLKIFSIKIPFLPF